MFSMKVDAFADMPLSIIFSTVDLRGFKLVFVVPPPEGAMASPDVTS